MLDFALKYLASTIFTSVFEAIIDAVTEIAQDSYNKIYGNLCCSKGIYECSFQCFKILWWSFKRKELYLDLIGSVNKDRRFIGIINPIPMFYVSGIKNINSDIVDSSLNLWQSSIKCHIFKYILKIRLNFSIPYDQYMFIDVSSSYIILRNMRTLNLPVYPYGQSQIFHIAWETSGMFRLLVISRWCICTYLDRGFVKADYWISFWYKTVLK